MKPVPVIASVIGAATLIVLVVLLFKSIEPSRSSSPNSAAPVGRALNHPGPPGLTNHSSISNRVLPAAESHSDELQLRGEDSLRAVENFSSWVEQLLAGNASTGPNIGEALAWKRREALRQLIRADPEKAIAVAVPFRWRQELPSNITRHFEQWVDGRGSLRVAMPAGRGQGQALRQVQIGGKEFNAFVYGRRLRHASRFNIPLHGLAIDRDMAVLVDSIRRLEPNEVDALEQERGFATRKTCAVCTQPVAMLVEAVVADIGGELAYFCGPDHARAASERLAESAGYGGAGGAVNLASPASDAWTRGPKSLLYMRINFPDDLTEPISEAESYRVMDDVNAFYTESSYNLTALTTTVAPLVTVPNVKAWYSTAGPFALLLDAREATRRAGFDTENYSLDVVSHTSVPDFDWGGLGFVYAKGTWLQSHGVGVTAHELGHNYGLFHANFWNASTNGSIYGPGTNVAYGNVFDTMGQASAGNHQFGAMFKHQLNWITDTAIQDVTSNGVYRLHALDAPARVNGRIYGARIKRDFERNYWIEFRQRFAGNRWLQHGVLLNGSPWDRETGDTDLLDTTPGTPTEFDSREDAALVIGRTFSDWPAGIHITPLRRGGAGDDSWMEVRVNAGGFPGNRSPVMTLELEKTNVAPGTLVHFHATATDPDGDELAYAWTFDDLSFSTNNLPWTVKSWAIPGDHVLRCVVSDMKGGVASANAIVTVGAREGFRLSGRVTDLEGLPLEGVRVDNGAVTAEDYRGGYTDSDGNYVIVNVTGELTLSALKYGHTLTNANWDNPVSPINDMVAVDFVAVPQPVVSVAASTQSLPESIGTNVIFTLTCPGERTNDLAVQLHLSGSASRGTDYILNPALSETANTVIFPGGTNTLAFAVTVLNDPTVEGPETITMTVLDDELYINGSLGEATLTILDDDAPVKPEVSIVAVTPNVPENGVDSGTFLFSRSGGTQGDLPVHYTVSGSAMPGGDYSSMVGVVLLPAGSRSAKIQFQTLDDKNVEQDETVIVAINTNAAYTPGSNSTAQVTITDDDLLTVTVSATDNRLAEPAATGRFTIQREGDLTANLLVNYSVAGTATAGNDFTPLAGVVTIPKGAASVEVEVTALDDSFLEGDESVTLVLSTNISYNIGTPGSATLMLRDNERTLVNIRALDAEASEPGEDGARFEVSRGSVVNGDLLVHLAVSGSAISGVDYVPFENPVTITHGANSVTLEVIPFDDLHLEPVEQVLLAVMPGTNYGVSTPVMDTVNLIDNDEGSVPAVGFAFSTSSSPENRFSGAVVSLSHTSTVPVTVDYRVIGGTASSADYDLSAGPLMFEPGQRAKSIPIEVIDNSLAQPNRTLRLAIFNPVNATLDGIKIHTCTIVDDDTAALSIVTMIPAASETGPLPGSFRLSRTGATNEPLVVKYQVTGSASVPSDYASLGNAVTIPAGARFADLAVIPVNDQIVEDAETVVVTLISTPASKIVSPHSATVMISDNDPNALPVVVVTSTNQPYAVEGGSSGQFIFRRDGTNGALILDFTLSGTASNGVDYLALGSSVTIPHGQTSAALSVAPVNDLLIEGEETVVAALTVRDSYRVAFPSSTAVVLQDNDQRVRVDASDFKAAESGSDSGEFTFTRFGTTNTPLTVFFTVSGTASNGVDYAAIPNSVVIPAGDWSVVLPIVPLDDTLVEGLESMTLTLLASPAYAFDQPTSGTIEIMDDEPMLSITALVTNVVEGSWQPAIFRITRTGDPKYDVTARLAIGGTASYGVDYPPFMTNIYFSCHILSIDLLLYPTNEVIFEEEESVVIVLLPSPHYTILSPSNAVVAVIDAGTNQTPSVAISGRKSDVVFLPGTNVNMILEGSAMDDGDTNTPPWFTWSQADGPDTLSFGDTNNANSTVSFTNVGVYTLRLTADDGLLQGAAEVTAVVGAVQLLSTNLLHWTFDEGSGTNAFDLSGAGRNGMLQGPTWTTNGSVNGSLVFAATNDCVRLTGSSNFLNGLQAFSVALWVNAAASNSHRGILCADDSGTNVTLGLSTRVYASCGSSTNVIEAVIPTTAGTARYISANNVSTSGWQHLVLTWSNGLSPALFINGRLDQPMSQRAPLGGVLTNCPQFVVGKDPANSPISWNGGLDDVRIFPRALTAGEITALAGLPPDNYGPWVDLGSNVTVQLISPFELTGTVIDDGNIRALSNGWSVLSSPTTVTLDDPASLTNTIQFSEAGEYVFRLIADDGQATVYNDLTVTVIAPTQVDIFAADSDASELGPDTGEFVLTRNGDTNDLTVNLIAGGFASNGVDFIELPLSVTFETGNNQLSLTLQPFLDHRIEGDEPFTLTLVSNSAYTIGSGEATVIVHDSPYGVWSVERFTLEELTDPGISGEQADPDHDGLMNFVEYAMNRDPESLETNSPVVLTFETDPDDGLVHATVAYPRRLPPTDVEYDVRVSPDLITWNSGTDYIREMEAVDDGNGLTETVKTRLVAPVATSTNRFITVRVWLKATGP